MNYSKIYDAARKLQELVAEAIKEEMPEHASFTIGMWKLGEDVSLFSNDGGIVLKCTVPELKEQSDRLRVADLFREQGELQDKLKEINKQIVEVSK